MHRNIVHLLILFLVLAARPSEAASRFFTPDSVRYKIDYHDSTILGRTITVHSPIGYFIGGGVNFLSVTDKALPFPLSNYCDVFIKGKGTTPFFQAGIDLSLNSEGTFHLRPALSYQSLATDHTWGEYAPATDTTGGVRHERTVQFDHVITNHTTSLGLQALVEWKPFPALSLGIGPSLDLLFNNTYDKVIRAVTPGDVIYVNGVPTREVTEASGTLPNANSIAASLNFRVATSFPLSTVLCAEPSAAYSLALSGVTSYWKISAVQAGITLRYQAPEGADTTITVRHIDVPVRVPIADTVKHSVFTASVEAYANGLNGEHEQVAKLIVEEVRARDAYPMLNYIFFDSASSAIAPRYVQYTSAEEAEHSFRGSFERRGERTADLYLETLNILGDRLKHSPASRIRLVGSGSNTGVEEGNSTIGLQRAEAIRNYLATIWKIDKSRVSVSGRLLPEKPSPNTLEGQEENRRVEIIADDPKLTDPLYVTNIEHTSNPPNLSVLPIFEAATAPIRYHGSFKIGATEVWSFDGTTSGGVQNTNWLPTEEALNSKNDSLVIELRAIDATNAVAVGRTSIKLEQQHTSRDEEQRIDRFSLILFGFDEAKLGSKNERTLSIIADALKRIKPKQIIISGYTDEVGDDAHNNDLSKRRAEEAATHLRVELKKRSIDIPPNITIQGLGASGKLYNNRLPEGRFLSRTVIITLER